MLYFPQFQIRVFYSEIFDKYLKIMSTRGLAEQVDAHFGLDYYILKVKFRDYYEKAIYGMFDVSKDTRNRPVLQTGQ